MVSSSIWNFFATTGNRSPINGCPGLRNSATCSRRRSSSCWARVAGGCAMNSVANGKIRRMSAFRRVYVQSAAGDAGGAIGAAFAVWHQLGGARAFVMDHAYWGPSFGGDDVAALLAAARSQIIAAGCQVEDVANEAELCRRAAAAIADGKV